MVINQLEKNSGSECANVGRDDGFPFREWFAVSLIFPATTLRIRLERRFLYTLLQFRLQDKSEQTVDADKGDLFPL